MHNLVMNQSTISKKYLTNVVKLDKNRKKGIIEVYVDESIKDIVYLIKHLGLSSTKSKILGCCIIYRRSHNKMSDYLPVHSLCLKCLLHPIERSCL